MALAIFFALKKTKTDKNKKKFNFTPFFFLKFIVFALKVTVKKKKSFFYHVIFTSSNEWKKKKLCWKLLRISVKLVNCVGYGYFYSRKWRQRFIKKNCSIRFSASVFFVKKEPKMLGERLIVDEWIGGVTKMQLKFSLEQRPSQFSRKTPSLNESLL